MAARKTTQNQQQIAERTFKGIDKEIDRVVADNRPTEVYRSISTDRLRFYDDLQQRWNQAQSQN